MAVIDQAAIDVLFANARSQAGWKPDPVSDAEIEAAYNIAKWGPTSMNSQPMRILFLRSAEAKERLKPALSAGNVEKTLTAPVVAVIANDMAFYEHLDRMFPTIPNAKNIYLNNAAVAQATAVRNGTLHAAYFMLGLRAIGLDVGPMSGFDIAKVDAEFFAGTTWKTNFLCGIGRGDPKKLGPRMPRLELKEISKTL